MVGPFEKIESAKISDVLSSKKRVYLTGDLKLPQDIAHVHSKDIEIGITDFKGGESEPPHHHTVQTEFMYVISGSIRYRDVIAKKDHEYRAGDFFYIPPKTCYTQRAEGSSRIIFVKIPSVNDKVECSACKKQCSERVKS